MSLDTPRVSSRLDLLYLVTREFNADLEIDQVLRNVLSATVAAVGASDASLILFDAEGKLATNLAFSDFKMQKRSATVMETITQHGVAGWVRQNRTGVLIEDVNDDERWYQDASNPELVEVRSAVCVPIQLPDTLIGILTITSRQPKKFEEGDLAMLSIIADQAAFALTNARLFEAEQQRRRLADTLTSTTQTINSSLDLDEVLDLILEQLRLVVDYDSSSILLFEDDATLAVRAAKGFDNIEEALKVRLTYDEYSPNFQAIYMKIPFVIPDVDQEPHWVKSVSSKNVRSWIGAPLIARGQAVGILTVDSHELDKYQEDTVKIVATFADHAATAVANAQAVTQLQKAEATYASLFEDSTDIIFITDYDGIILDINRKACLILRRPKEFFIRSTISFIDPQLKKYLAEQTKRLKVWREPSIELEVKDAYRQTVPLEIKVRQIQYKGKEGVEWVGRDISARKEIEQLRQDMVHMLVHDLRGPLGNIINIIDLIKMMLATQPNHPKLPTFLDMAKRSGQTIKDLVDSMLDVSRLEEGEVPLQRSMTDIAELLLAVQEQVGPQAEAKDMALIIDPVPDDLAVWLDTSLIRRVLINVVGNAVKYTPLEGHIVVSTNVTESELHFTVSDDGPGISPQNLTSIFDKFSRADYSTSISGVGLGLAFCKLAVEAHEGKIYAESDGIPGQGSIFHVVLPIMEPTE
ncbi:MAG: GAF domain-containing protein [Anaerolineales bacterium]|nr:GAF domain-containing protein [Anaerolineales bacterium]